LTEQHEALCRLEKEALEKTLQSVNLSKRPEEKEEGLKPSKSTTNRLLFAFLITTQALLFFFVVLR